MAGGLLSLILFLPLLGTVAIALARNPKAVRAVALLFTLAPLLLAVPLVANFVYSFGAFNSFFQFTEKAALVPYFGISYSLGVDGLSLPLVALTVLLFFLAAVFSWDVEHRPRAYFGLLLLMETGVLGVFSSLDLFLFFVFWEVVLIPMYFFIAIWGGPRRDYASFKFLIYTNVGGLVMLLGLVALFLSTGGWTFDLVEIGKAAPGLPQGLQALIFSAFLFGFGIKFPLVPVHTWLPDAHVEAPTAGSVLLAGLLLKMGGYGLLRFGFGMLPGGVAGQVPLLPIRMTDLMLFLAVLSILYGAAVCLSQRDLKRLVAYSSVSHMGFVLLGYTVGTPLAVQGAVFMMVSHGLISPLLFMAAGALQHHAGSRDIPRMSGMASKMPLYATLLTLGALASVGVPGMSGFVAEFLVFLGTWPVLGIWTLLPIGAVVIGTAYLFWALMRAMFGPTRIPQEAHGPKFDVAPYEAVPMALLMAAIVLFGLFPEPLLRVLSVVGGG